MNLTEDQKRDLVGRIAEQWTQNQDIKELEYFYYEAQEQYLDGLTDEELLEIAEDSGLYAE